MSVGHVQEMTNICGGCSCTLGADRTHDPARNALAILPVMQSAETELCPQRGGPRKGDALRSRGALQTAPQEG